LPGIALSPEGDGLAVVDAGRDADRDPLALFHAAAAAAGLAGSVNDLARPPAAGAGGGAGEGEAAGALLHPDHAGAPAVGTGLRRGARLRAGAVAGLALLSAVQVDLLLTAEGRLFEGDGQTGPQALSLLGTVAPAGG